MHFHYNIIIIYIIYIMFSHTYPLYESCIQRNVESRCYESTSVSDDITTMLDTYVAPYDLLCTDYGGMVIWPATMGLIWRRSIVNWPMLYVCVGQCMIDLTPPAVISHIGITPRLPSPSHRGLTSSTCYKPVTEVSHPHLQSPSH